MSVNNIGGNYSSYSTYLTDKNKPISAKSTQSEGEAAQSTAAAATENVSTDGDTFEKTAVAKPDRNKVGAMKAELWNKVDAFEQMVNALFLKQGIQYDASLGMKKNLEDLILSGGVSETERLAAQQAISEDGEWGVKKTAERILNFAKALCGDDPDKIESIREAVKKGFKEAEQVWGGELPAICQQTYDRVMQGFDDWASTAKASAAASE